jgi:hypothetical protein
LARRKGKIEDVKIYVRPISSIRYGLFRHALVIRARMPHPLFSSRHDEA